jgi:hypothetical protein
MSDTDREERVGEVSQFDDGRGVTWTTGLSATERGKRYRWFRAAERRERRYELRNGEAKDMSIASLRAQLHASVAMKVKG